MSAMCAEFAWCDVEHPNLAIHVESAITANAPGVLRSDHVLDGDEVKLSITEMIEWEIPAAQVPEFLAGLRRNIDEIEARFTEFTAKVRPIRRRTEPGDPMLAEEFALAEAEQVGGDK